MNEPRITGRAKPDWTNPSAWGDLKLPARARLARAFRLLLRSGELQRADIQRIGEVCAATASTDLRILQSVTGALVYDKSAKRYRLKEEVSA